MVNKINVSCIGDPMEPKTWSGTPYNICRELTNKKQLGSVLDSSINNSFIKGIFLGLSKIMYGSGDYARSNFYRKATSNIVYKKFLSNDKLNILHMGTLDMPVNKNDKNKQFKENLITHYGINESKVIWKRVLIGTQKSN